MKSKAPLSYLLTTSIVVALQGCASIVDHTNNLDDPYIIEPTPSNGFNGVLAGRSSAKISDLEARVIAICAGRGGVRQGPTYKLAAVISGTYYSYQCMGQAQANPQFPPTQHVQQPVLNSTPKINIESAKAKCGDLGFKQGTEGFGKCVLQLTK
jgi:hypothetical protein